VISPFCPVFTTIWAKIVFTEWAMASESCMVPADSSAASSVCVDQASTKTTTEPLVSIIDTSSNTEIDGRVNLNQAWQAAYVAANTTDDNTRRYPLVADDIAFVPGTSIGYFSANGAMRGPIPTRV